MAAAADNDPLLGRVIDGRFTIQSVLGKGGMGVVYRAHQASLERSVALKLMTGVDPERESEFQRRFFLEAATVARLKHPNTITVFDYGSSLVDDQRVFFIAMELLDGVTLSKVLGGKRRLEPLRAVHIGMQICRSLREAHKAGVVHRDLKPGNVMLVNNDDDDADAERDFVKVLDFGLAKTKVFDGARPIDGLTKTGTFMGSPRYVAPEQIEGKPVDARADIYSFGCVMYRMLSGAVPFDGQQPVDILLKHMNDPPPQLDAPGTPFVLRELVMACLHKAAKDRPASMEEVLVRLKSARQELGGAASGVHNLERSGSGARAVSVEVSMPSEPPIALDRPIAPPTQPPQPQPSRTPIARTAAPETPHSGLPAPTPVRSADRSAPTTQPTLSAVDEEWQLGLGTSDPGARPTRLASSKKPRRPYAAITLGVLVGLVLCAALVVDRLGGFEPLLARLFPEVEEAPTPPPVLHGPVAKRVRVRVMSKPPGADVLEVKDGLPHLLGITPLTIDWQIDELGTPRELLLRKEGFVPSKATLVPPLPPADGGTAWLDVEATLRAQPAKPR